MSEEDFTPVSGSVEADEEEAAENEDIEKAMVAFMRKRFKWSHKELHDALLSAGVAVPLVPSMPNYVATLHARYGDADTGFMPQSFHSHTKVKLQQILKILSRGGAKLGGKLADTKGVLAERLAHWLNLVLDAGRKGQSDSSDEDGVDGKDFDERPRQQNTVFSRSTQGP